MLKTPETTANISRVNQNKSPLTRNGTSGIPVLLRRERQIKTRTSRSPDCTYSQLHQLTTKKIAARNVFKGLATTTVSEVSCRSETGQAVVNGVAQQLALSSASASASAVPVQHLMAFIGSVATPPPPPPASIGSAKDNHQTESLAMEDDGCGCCCCADDCPDTGPSRVPPREGPNSAASSFRWWLVNEGSCYNYRNVDSSQLRRKPRKPPEGSFAMSCQGSFCRLLQYSPPSLPPALLKGLDRRESSAIGRVKVMLRLSSSAADSPSSEEAAAAATASFMALDARKKQVTIYEPHNSSLGPTEKRNLGIAAPKMFAFDNIFSSEDSQSEVCSRALSDILPTVVNGSDACLFTYGYSKLGKTRTMVGTCDSVHDLGVMPCATWWLFKLIDEQKQRSGARFSVRVSATEIAGKDEVVRDLLASQAHGTEVGVFSQGNFRREDTIAFGCHLQNQCELRAPSAEKAAYYLDTALASRSTEFPESDGISHFLFTFHIYQYSVDKSRKGGMDGGRSRLYLLDLGGCDKQSQVYSSSKSYRLSMANLGNVILAMFNGQKHVPYKDGKLTQVLREILGNATCRASMLAHVSPSPGQYTESLATIQLASRIHRLRHKKWKYFHSGGGEGLSDDSFGHHLRRGETANGLRSSSSDFDYTSSDTCETVIFVGQPRESRTIHEEPANEKPSSDPLHAYNPRAGLAHVRRMHGNLFNRNNNDISSNQQLPLNELMRDEGLPPFINHRNFFEHVQFTDNFLNAIRVDNGMRCNFSSENAEVRRRADGVTSASDEFWVDGPRIRRSKLHVSRRRGGTRTLATATGPETWVDGPASGHDGLRYLDDQKRVMIENWIDMQSDSIDNKCDIGGDDSSDSDTLQSCCQNDSATFARAVDGVVSKRFDPTVALFNEVDVVSTVDSVVSGDDTEKSDSAVASVTYQEIVQLCSQYRENESPLRDFFREASLDDASLEAQDDISVNQRWMSLVTPKEEGRVSPMMARKQFLSDDQFVLELDGVEEIEGDMMPSEAEVDGAGETVYMTDSWVQVSEVDLQEPPPLMMMTATTRIRRRRTASAKDYEDHPLRALSSESLAISFTNSSRMSWDSGLNAVRKAMAAARIMDDDTPFDFGPYAAEEPDHLDSFMDARSICSEPGTSSSIALSMERLRKLNAFGCKSLSGLLRSRSFSASDHSLCSCDDCHIKWLRRPDGASDPQLDRHQASPSRVGEDTRCFWKSTEDFPIVTKDNYIFARTFESDDNTRGPASTERNECEVYRDAKRTMGSGRSAVDALDLRPENVVADSSLQVRSKNSDYEGVDLHKFDLRGVSSLPAPCVSVLDERWCDERIVLRPTDVRQGGADDDGLHASSGDHPDEEDKEQPSSTATSSGYNSMPRDGDGSGGSVSAVEDSASLNSEDVLLSPGHVTTQTALNSSSEHNGSTLMSVHHCASALPANVILLDKHGLASFELRVYDEEDVARMERRRAFEKELELQRRCSRIRLLRKKQEELRQELKMTKLFLMVDNSKWSYDLFVEQSMDVDDPAFLEAFEMETSILEKRVAACKSHLMFVTCFDVTDPDELKRATEEPITPALPMITASEKCTNT